MAEYPATITKALHDVMSAVGYVQKKGRNEFHRYNYAGEADLLEVLRPAMLKAGLLLIPSGAEHSPVDEYGNTRVSVAYTLAHKDGDVWPDKIIAFGCGNDKNSKGGVQDKGTYKALTGANKYLLFKLFQIETGDDPEGAEHETPAIPGGVSPHDMDGSTDSYITKTTLKKEVEVLMEHVGVARSLDEIQTLKLQYEHKHGDEPSLMDRVKKDLPKAWHGRVVEVFAEAGAKAADRPNELGAG